MACAAYTLAPSVTFGMWPIRTLACNSLSSPISALVSDAIAEATPTTSKKLGSVGGFSAYACTAAPSSDNQSASRLPLNPVWPYDKDRSTFPKASLETQEFPRRLSCIPELFEQVFVAQRIHWLPKPLMLKRHQFVAIC